jgi:hypothetical protein
MKNWTPMTTLLLAGSLLGMVATMTMMCTSCGPKGGLPASSPSVDLGIELGFSTASFAAGAAQVAAIEGEDADGCLAAVVVLATIEAGHSAWSAASRGRELADLVVEAGPCLALGAVAPEWDAVADLAIRQAAETTTIALRIAQHHICVDDPNGTRCAGVTTAADVSDAVAKVYGLVAAELQSEAAAPDGRVVIELHQLGEWPVNGVADDDDSSTDIRRGAIYPADVRRETIRPQAGPAVTTRWPDPYRGWI